MTILIGVIQIIYPARPSLDVSGQYIFWHPYSIAALLITAGLVGVALIFAFIFFVGAFYLKENIFKIRNLLFAIGAFSLAISAYYFVPKNTDEFNLSSAFSIGGVFMVALGLAIARIFKRHSGEGTMKRIEA